MNPYLATAAIIAAGLDGIDRDLTPPDACSLNFYDLSPQAIADMGVSCLPENLDAALDALEADAFFKDALGERLINSYLNLKRSEWKEYHRTVSEWEVNRYLTFY